MKISIFLSRPEPYNDDQEKFLNQAIAYLEDRGLQPRTLGDRDFDPRQPLIAVRRLMMESNGIITIAFRRSFINEGVEKPGTTKEKSISGSYLTSPWCQIETAMAFQLGLPIAVFREEGVIANGLLGKGVTNVYLPEFKSSDFDTYFKEAETKEILGMWEGYVREVYMTRGRPPRLYDK